MLIASMNQQEIQDEIGNDYEKIISSSTLHRQMHEYYKKRKKNKVSKEADFPIYREFKTNSKNHWLTRITKKRSVSKFNSVEDCETVCFTYYHSSIGLRVFYRTPSGAISAFNGHLFTRYRERMNLSTTDPIALVKTFFANNRDFNYMIMDKEKYERKIVGIIQDGYLLGEVLEENGWFIHKTFINKSTANFRLKSSEAEFSVALRNALQSLDPLTEKDLAMDLASLYQNLGFMKGNDFNKNIGNAINSFKKECLDDKKVEKDFLVIT